MEPDEENVCLRSEIQTALVGGNTGQMDLEGTGARGHRVPRLDAN
jgi:hypothetical protein